MRPTQIHMAMAAAVFSFSSLAAAGAAPTVLKIDLSEESVQQQAVAPGTIELELFPLVPGATYEINKGQKLTAEKAPKADDAKEEPDLCKNPNAWLWNKLAAASDEGKIGVLVRATTPNELKHCDNDGQTSIRAAIDEIRTRNLTSSIILEHKVDPPRTLEIKRGEKVWTVYLVRGAPVDPDLLHDIEKRMAADSSSTILECSFPEGQCGAKPLYVNSDHVSIVVFRGVPTGVPLTVVVDSMSEPFEGCQALRQNSISFPKAAPDVVAVTLHLFRDPLLGLTPSSRRVAAALRLYGFPEVDSNNGDSKGSGKPTSVDERCQVSDSSTLHSPRAGTRSKRAAIRSYGGATEEVTTIPIVADGHTETVKVTFYSKGEPLRSFIVPFRYQRWWADAGGAFLFPNIDDERVKTEPDGTGKVKVVAIERDEHVEPDTGIVVNLHPGNYPAGAFQFGLSTGRDSELSYYLGAAVRMREIGKRGLATFSAGASFSKTQSYPDLTLYDPAKPAAGGIYEPTDARLVGIRQYELDWYFGVSLGFTFGGVASGADAVKELP